MDVIKDEVNKTSENLYFTANITFSNSFVFDLVRIKPKAAA